MVNFTFLMSSLSPFQRPFSRWTWISWYQNVSILDFIGAKSVGSGDNWSYKTCKAPVKSSPPTNQHLVFTDRMPLLSTNQQCQSTEGKSKAQQATFETNQGTAVNFL